VPSICHRAYHTPPQTLKAQYCPTLWEVLLWVLFCLGPPVVSFSPQGYGTFAEPNVLNRVQVQVRGVWQPLHPSPLTSFCSNQRKISCALRTGVLSWTFVRKGRSPSSAVTPKEPTACSRRRYWMMSTKMSPQYYPPPPRTLLVGYVYPTFRTVFERPNQCEDPCLLHSTDLKSSSVQSAWTIAPPPPLPG
jgi:hypothetical protein